MSKCNSNLVGITLRLDKEIHKQISAEAKVAGVSLNTFIGMIIKERNLGQQVRQAIREELGFIISRPQPNPYLDMRAYTVGQIGLTTVVGG